MNKTYTRIVWENYTSTNTPLNAQNLNKMDKAIDDIDDRVIALDTAKAEESDLLTSLSNVTYNEQTGIFVFTWKNGTTKEVDLNVEKIPVSFSMSKAGVITMTNADGTKYTADVSTLIKTYSFANTSEITWTVTTDADGNKTITPALVDGGISENKLQPNFLADCRTAKAGAEAAVNDAAAEVVKAEAEKLVAEGYATGKQNGRDVGPDSEYYHNNAKYYSDKAGGSSLTGLTDVDIQNPVDKQALVWDNASSKWVNGDASGKTELTELTDVNIQNPTDKQSLIWDAQNSKWINGDVETGKSALSELTDVDLTSPQDDQALVYENGKWINKTVQSGGDTGVELTQAEYDALPESKYSDNVNYYITDTEDLFPFVKLTQAEYDDLPDSKLTDNILYMISDGDELTAETLPYDESVSVKEKIDSINVDLKVYDVVTRAATTSNYSSELSLQRIGNMVIVSGYIHTLATSTDWQAVFSNIPYYPIRRVIIGKYAANVNTDAEIRLDTNGTLYVAGSAAGRIQLINFTYICS